MGNIGSRQSPWSREEAIAYWQSRHASTNDWSATGYAGGPVGVNEAFYASRFRALRRAVERLGGVRGKRVLDVGCGRGDFATFYHQQGAIVSGIDVSSKAVEHCNALHIGTFTQSSAGEARGKLEGHFDFIHCFDVLYHLTDEREWRAALKAFADLSSDDTTWLITDFRVPKTYTSSQHIVKRSLAHYQSVLAPLGRRIVHEIPLYWFFVAFPRVASRFPQLIGLADWLGPVAGSFSRERVVLWVIQKRRF